MALTPEARALVDLASAGFPRLGTEVRDAAAARRMLAARPAAPATPVPVAHVADRRIPAGIRVREYRPLPCASSAKSTALPAVVFYHGGGFVICDLDSHDRWCRTMANAIGAVVISVEYRQAPEHRFPAAAEDAYAALHWTADHADELRVDPARIAVAGDSAGGNLATVAAQASRDRTGPRPAFQLLMYPMLDPACATPSYRDNADGYFTTAAHLRWFWDQYLSSPADRTDPRANPLRADLAALPPALVITAEHDPLRDEGETYARRLRAAGVPARTHRAPAMFHGFMTMAAHLREAAAANSLAFTTLRAALHPR
ncbi:MAG: alpha/beta hydrolase [Mycobacteriaceae bacterium]|nr:alpha/beta hydrolase [Mycobacteriaceae bacterium]